MFHVANQKIISINGSNLKRSITYDGMCPDFKLVEVEVEVPVVFGVNETTQTWVSSAFVDWVQLL